MSNARIYNLDLRGMNAKILGTDVGPVKNSVAVSQLEISPGERYELEITAPENAGNITLYDTYFNNYPPVVLATLTILDTQTEPSLYEAHTETIPDWQQISYSEPDVTIDL